MRYTKLWVGLGVVVAASFATLGYFGLELYRQAPPIPERVVTTAGKVLFTGQDIHDGQNVWQSMGGQEVGSIWGHGAYVAPDWSADWLHREASYILEKYAATDFGKSFSQTAPEQQAALKARLKQELRTNTYNPETKELAVSPLRAEAIAAVGVHYAGLFGHDPALQDLRKAYAVPADTIKDPKRQELMNAFFFWTAWTCGTNRPGAAVTYTNNWPAESLIDNTPSSSIVVWSVMSFVMLLAGVGALTWYTASKRRAEPHVLIPDHDPLLKLQLTPSMRATLKYFWLVAALIIAQVGLGGITAHYGVDGLSFYGFELSRYVPYSLARTWHTQLGIFWIATAWLATGLFVAPAVSGYEPKFQRAGVNFLFACLLIIVTGSFTLQWFTVMQKLGLEAAFWFGHQGYEYVDLGRFWQMFLLVGLFLWLGLMVRAMLPAMKKPGENRSLLALFLISALAIGLFYGAGLMWGRQTHLAIAEYWRWWVIHLWVEGFFEVFATVVIAFLFTRLGLLKTATATASVLFSTAIFLSGGIIGTFHHLYFTGTPTVILALGSVFSALEIVPLVLIGYEAYENLSLTKLRPWVLAYKWPIYFFVAVAFWNLVGAGVFGFLINPPIALYYVQGLNTTAVHGHTALFGVYGMLGIGLMLFCLKALSPQRPWKNGPISLAFWSINIGLALMVLLSLLPIGVLQAIASMENGMWYARSADFMQQHHMQVLRWLRMIGDTVFAIGTVSLVYFIAGLKTGWSLESEGKPAPVPEAELVPASGE
ncbi:MAG TPA: nitric-oxide reductase large subunit [Planctomycetota bacterium]